MSKKTFIAAIIITAFLVSLVAGMQVVKVAEAQFSGSVIINSDGSVTGTSNIQRDGNVYTFVSNIFGGIQVQKSNIVIDGANFSLQGNSGIGIDLSNGVGQNPSRPTISNVTIKNAKIIDCSFGVQTNGGGNHTLYGNYLANCSESCINLIGTCSFNNISYCTIIGVTAISMNYGSNYNTITENNITGGVMVWLSGYETIDKNYWSYYLMRYPNATEIDNTGIGNTPYELSTAQNGSSTIIYQDDHPLMKPVTTLGSSVFTPSPIPTLSPTPSPTPTITASLSESASALNYGNRINFTVSVDGGVPPYTFAWYVDDQIAETSSSQNYSTNTLQVGSHHVYVQVIDANDNRATTLANSFEVLPALNPSSTGHSTPSPNIVSIWGNNIILYLVAVAVIVVVILLVIFILRRK